MSNKLSNENKLPDEVVALTAQFQIGDTAYYARAGNRQVWITCPECLGSGRLRVILGDGSEVSIECVCCDRGYEGSPGKIQTYDFVSEVDIVTIYGIESNLVNGALHTRYKFDGCYSTDQENLFLTKEEAKNRADVLAAEHAAEEKKKIGYKEKQTKTWARNASYHRQCIAKAQQQIVYHTSKLTVAAKNAKEDKQNAKQITE